PAPPRQPARRAGPQVPRPAWNRAGLLLVGLGGREPRHDAADHGRVGPAQRLLRHGLRRERRHVFGTGRPTHGATGRGPRGDCAEAADLPGRTAARRLENAVPAARPMGPLQDLPLSGRAQLSCAERRTQMRMTTEEAFVKVLQMHGIEHAFGIIGSAMMPVSDLFPKAGITFWDCAHETNGGLMCDGFIRATGKMAMAIAQNGPGVTGFVTAVKTADWNHTPMLLVTPQAANKTIGQGGFQEMEQMRMFADCVCYQEEVRDPSRIPEVLNRVILKAWRASAPAQINIPRDMWTQVIDVDLPQVVKFERPAGGEEAVAEAARLLSEARFPVILSGAGVVLSGAIPDVVKLAERLDAPVCSNYQHNDSFPG